MELNKLARVESRLGVTVRGVVTKKEALLPQTDARDSLSVEILSPVAQLYRNKLYDKSTTNRSNGVRALQTMDM